MNDRYRAFIEFGRRLATEHGAVWNLKLQKDGKARTEDSWNLTSLVHASPPPVHWIRDFGYEAKALVALNKERAERGLSELSKGPLSSAWIDLVKTAIMEQLFSKKNSTGHVVLNIARPLRILATAACGREPWELSFDDVKHAFELAKGIQASGKLSDSVLSVVKSVFDANHIADVGPLYARFSELRLASNKRRARHVKSIDELRSNLTERSRAERLPERRAFWELNRIVFTETPKTFLDLLRFAQVKVMLLCGLRVGEVSLLPKDWKRVRHYYDTSGRPAGEFGGYSAALMLRYYAEKQQDAFSDSRALVETAQYVPAIFEHFLEDTLDEIVSVTQPLRETLRRQIEEDRILPWFERDEIVSAVELYPYLTGNPELLDLDDSEIAEWQAKYRARFSSEIFETIHEEQLRLLRSGCGRPGFSVYMYYHRLKGKVTFRRKDGSDWGSGRKIWSEVFLQVGEVEDYLSKLPTKLSDQSSIRVAPDGEIKVWDLLFLMPKRALAEGRNDGLCDVTRYYSVGRSSPPFIQVALSNLDSQSGPTLFETYGKNEEDRELKLNSHSLRHLQNTELFRLGVADTIITKRFGRNSVAQSYEYDHRSLAEDLAHIDLPVDVEAMLGSKASTVARMIKAGKANGPIVDSFRRIQQTDGDEAAFEYLKVEADGFHSTPYGHCINSFTVDPCPKHLECFAGCRHLTATDIPKYRRNLEQLEGRFRSAVDTIEKRPASTIGRDNQLSHANARLAAVRKILATPQGQQVFPDGKDFSILDQPRSVLDDRDEL